MKSKERITPPSKRLLSTAGRNLRDGDTEAARILSEQAAAKQQGAKRPKKK